jgi:metal-responsive CopG/Arc/MetJ family transcriptional regulator
MSKAKIAITLDERVLERLDSLVEKKIFANRSRAIEAAVEEKLERLGRIRLAEECAKLDPVAEKDLAEEGLVMEASEWPEY